MPGTLTLGLCYPQPSSVRQGLSVYQPHFQWKEKAMTSPDKTDVYTRITDRIIADLEKGVRPWMKPWSGDNTAGASSAHCAITACPIRGINILMLWASAIEQGLPARSG